MIHLFMVRHFIAKVGAMLVVCFPCFSESSFAIERQEMFKDNNCPLMFLESRKQSIVGSVRVGANCWVENCQFIDEGVFEFDGCGSERIVAMNVEKQASSEQRSQEGSYGSWNSENFQWFLAGIIPILMFVFDALLNKPNVQAKPPARGGSA